MSSDHDKKQLETASKAGSIVTTPEKKVEWTEENEKIMAEWCDIAQCYKWLHTRAHQTYSKMHAFFTIPAITLSTISGTASFAQASLPVQYQSFAPMVIGTLNIFIGILTTIQQYLKISELNESHRVAAISWDKFSRNIRIELAKSPTERMDCSSFLKMSRQEFDRMMETSPSIPIPMVNEFNKTFEGAPGSPERSRFDALKKPDICNIIETVKVDMYDRSKDILLNSDANSAVDFIEIEEQLKNRESLIDAKLKELKDEIQRKEYLEQVKKEDEEKRVNNRKEMKHMFEKVASEMTKKMKTYHKKIDDYVSIFESIYARRPVSDEILDNFKDDDIPTDIMDAYLAKYLLETDNNV